MKPTGYFKEIETIQDIGLQPTNGYFVQWLDAMNDFVKDNYLDTEEILHPPKQK